MRANLHFTLTELEVGCNLRFVAYEFKFRSQSSVASSQIKHDLLYKGPALHVHRITAQVTTLLPSD